jgi:hypothetical protein
MAGVVNNSLKIVFSKTLKNVEEGVYWKNIKLKICHGEIIKEKIRKLYGNIKKPIQKHGRILQNISRGCSKYS